MSYAEVLNIHDFMEIFGSCGNRVGHVDTVEGGTILLIKSDFADGRQHTVPIEWVDRVGKGIYLKKTLRQVKEAWNEHLVGV